MALAASCSPPATAGDKEHCDAERALTSLSNNLASGRIGLPPAPPPLESHALPPIIGRTPDIKTRPQELYAAGEFITDPNQLNALPDGNYVFLIDRENRIIWSHRTPNREANPDGLHLATHRALANFYRNIGGTEGEFVGAGECLMLNGKPGSPVSILNDKANTFHGNQENLDYSVAILKRAGLPVTEPTPGSPGTFVVHYSKNMYGGIKIEAHAKDEAESSALIRHHGSSEYIQTTNLFQILAERFPHPVIRGLFDRNAVRLVFRKFQAGTRVPPLLDIPYDQMTSQEMNLRMNINEFLARLEGDGPAIVVEDFASRTDTDHAQHPRFRTKRNLGMPSWDLLISQFERMFGHEFSTAQTPGL